MSDRNEVVLSEANLYNREEDFTYLEEKWKLRVSDPDLTGIRIFEVAYADPARVSSLPSVELMEPNPDLDYELITGYASAKASRDGSTFAAKCAEIFRIMREEEPDIAKKRVKQIVDEYGHDSVRDLLGVRLSFNRLPLYMAYKVFNFISKYAGQEWSTRYVKVNFDESSSKEGEFCPEFCTPEDIARVWSLPEKYLDPKTVDVETALETMQMWEAIHGQMQGSYNEFVSLFGKEFRRIFPKFSKDLKVKSGKVLDSTYHSRSLDLARLFLPMGTQTCMSLDLDLRTVRDLIGHLYESDDVQARMFARQLESTLSISKVEAVAQQIEPMMFYGELLNHHRPKIDSVEKEEVEKNFQELVIEEGVEGNIRKNIKTLKSYLLGREDFQELLNQSRPDLSDEREWSKVSELKRISLDGSIATLANYIVQAFPSLDYLATVKYIKRLRRNREGKNIVWDMGEILLNGHSNHVQLRNQADIRGSTIYILTTAMSVLRDLGRHRLNGNYDRFIEYIEEYGVQALIAQGFTIPDQLIRTKKLDPAILEKWKERANILYKSIRDFARHVHENYPDADPNWIRHLLPLGHRGVMHISMSPRSESYFTTLRALPGGDFEYVYLMMEGLKQLGNDPVFGRAAGELSKKLRVKVDEINSFAARS